MLSYCSVSSTNGNFLIFSPPHMAPQPLVDQGFLTIQASRAHSDTPRPPLDE
jgi:hypothetical protein